MTDDGKELKGSPPRTRSFRKKAGTHFTVAALLLIGIVFVQLSGFFAPQLSDDAFIFYRYADNLAAGRGPVWNAGERVEGFSSPLWLVLLTIGTLMGIDYIFASRLLGMVSAILVLAGTVLLSRRMGSYRWQGFVAAFVVSLCHGFHYWIPAGLEAPLYAAIVVWTAAGLAAGTPSRFILPVALLGIARPEGPALVLMVLLISRLTGRGYRLSPGTTAASILPSAVYLLFRVLYYGSLLPNTYYAKATGVQPAQTLRGFGYASDAWIAVILLLVATGLARRGHRLRMLPPLVFTTILLGIVTAGGGDWMWHGRLLVPVIPVLAALGISGIVPSRRIIPMAASAGSIIVLAAYLVPFPVLKLSFEGYTLPETLRQEGTLTDVSADAAHWIRERYNPDVTVAVNHAGALPYYLGYRCIDMTGLNDPVIARSPGGLHGKWDPAHVLGRSPELVVLNSRERPGTENIWYHPGYWRGETALFTHPEFQRRYRAIPVYWTWHWFGDSENYILLYERVDPPITTASW